MVLATLAFFQGSFRAGMVFVAEESLSVDRRSCHSEEPAQRAVFCASFRVRLGGRGICFCFFGCPTLRPSASAACAIKKVGWVPYICSAGFQPALGFAILL